MAVKTSEFTELTAINLSDNDRFPLAHDDGSGGFNDRYISGDTIGNKIRSKAYWEKYFGMASNASSQTIATATTSTVEFGSRNHGGTSVDFTNNYFVIPANDGAITYEGFWKFKLRCNLPSGSKILFSFTLETSTDSGSTWNAVSLSPVFKKISDQDHIQTVEMEAIEGASVGNYFRWRCSHSSGSSSTIDKAMVFFEMFSTHQDA